MKLCSLCNKQIGNIKHHTSYLPQELILVCSSCHNKIHRGNLKHLNPSRRMASIFYSNKGWIRNKVTGKVLRKLTKFELEIKKAMKNGKN